MNTTDMADIMRQAIDYYEENAQDIISDGNYKVSFNLNINSRRQEARISEVEINGITPYIVGTEDNT